MIDLDTVEWDREGRQKARAERCLRWLGSGRRPTARRLQALVAAMGAAGLGPASVNRHLSALRRVWPGLAVPWRREPRGRSLVVSRADVDSVCRRLGARHAALVEFLAETGMRAGEAWDLGEGDVVDGQATVRSSKNGDPRRVPLTDRALKAWRDAGPFSDLSRSGFQHAFRAAAAPVCPGLRPHDLRHACATRLTTAGVPLPTVAAWLGHRDIRSTLRYSHPGTEALNRAKGLLEQHG